MSLPSEPTTQPSRTQNLSGDEESEELQGREPPLPRTSSPPNQPQTRRMNDFGNPVGHWTEGSKLRSWFERLEVVFMDQEDEYTHDRWKVVKLIKWIGPEGYERLKMLCAPNLPIDDPYERLKELLLKNVDPEPTVLSKRYTFSWLQQGTLTVSDWEAQLKFHAAKCCYGTHYEQAVRDQFIFGLACNERIKLLEQENVSLKDAFKRAEARERARDLQLSSDLDRGLNLEGLHRVVRKVPRRRYVLGVS